MLGEILEGGLSVILPILFGIAALTATITLLVSIENLRGQVSDDDDDY